MGEQLAKRSRQLALANALGARLAGMNDVQAIAETTVEELRRAFGYHLSAVVRVRDRRSRRGGGRARREL